MNNRGMPHIEEKYKGDPWEDMDLLSRLVLGFDIYLLNLPVEEESVQRHDQFIWNTK